MDKGLWGFQKCGKKGRFKPVTTKFTKGIKDFFYTASLVLIFLTFTVSQDRNVWKMPFEPLFAIMIILNWESFSVIFHAYFNSSNFSNPRHIEL